VRRINPLDDDNNASNEEVHNDSDEIGGQKFLDFTIDLEGTSPKDLDPADSQLFVCNDDNDSLDEVEANNVLNELNDLILNMKPTE